MPLTKTVQRDLEIALETALMLAEPGTSNLEIVRRVYKNEPELMEQAKEPVLIDRMTWMLSRRKQALSVADQMTLPGFEDLPKRVTFKDGRRAKFHHLDLEQLKAYREILLERQDKRLDSVDRMIAMVEDEQRRTRSRVTVADVIAAERKKQEWKP